MLLPLIPDTVDNFPVLSVGTYTIWHKITITEASFTTGFSLFLLATDSVLRMDMSIVVL